jgi:hypothetical protein
MLIYVVGPQENATLSEVVAEAKIVKPVEVSVSALNVIAEVAASPKLQTYGTELNVAGEVSVTAQVVDELN